MIRQALSPAPAGDPCLTCQGVLRLQARSTRAGGEDIERIQAEARWLVLALKRVRPCPSHAGVLRLAHHLAGEIEDVIPDARMEYA